MSNIISENRFGTFQVSGTLMHDAPEEVILALRECLIVRAEHIWANDAVDYIAFSRYFDPVEAGMRAPFYNIIFTRHEDETVTFEFKKAEAYPRTGSLLEEIHAESHD